MENKLTPLNKPAATCKCGIPNCQGHRAGADGKILVTRHPLLLKKGNANAETTTKQ